MKRTTLLFTAIVIFFATGVYLLSCKEGYKKNSSHATVSDKSIRAGKQLAEKYCQSCHQLPDPALLGGKTWEEGVMPAMGPFLGIFEHNFRRYPSYKGDPYLPKSIYPDQPVLTNVEWQHIINYYAATSPDSLQGQQRKNPIQQTLSLFSIETLQNNYPSPAVTWIKIEDKEPNRRILFADMAKGLYRINAQLQPQDSVLSNITITDVDLNTSPPIVCNIGLINPNNGRFGKLHYLTTGINGQLGIDTAALVDSLARPVQLITSDLNNDGRMDVIVCEFGHLTGALSWLENTGTGKYNRHIMKFLPGCLAVYVQDYNKDGKEDIWALFTQGNEGIFLFTNKGNGTFEEKQVLSFPSVYGSTYFELADFNKDGFQDILYTCGDNADYSIVLKPYHGVYIYLNDGKNNFTQKYFYPINGCYKAMARDFDGDNDLDIASIAFFADFERQPEEGFVYLEQKPGFEFMPYTIPECKTGRWLTLDAGDLDGDNKPDLVLGNFSIRPSATASAVDWKKGPVFLFLKNKSK